MTPNAYIETCVDAAITLVGPPIFESLIVGCVHCAIKNVNIFDIYTERAQR